jgi:hypothetical protein
MQEQIQSLEVSLEDVKDKIALAEALDQLHRSPAFKKIILKGYFEDKAQNLVQMTALPQNEQQEKLIHNGMVGISALQQHFRAIYREGEQAQLDLEEYELALTEERAND